MSHLGLEDSLNMFCYELLHDRGGRRRIFHESCGISNGNFDCCLSMILRMVRSVSEWVVYRASLWRIPQRSLGTAARMSKVPWSWIAVLAQHSLPRSCEQCSGIAFLKRSQEPHEDLVVTQRGRTGSTGQEVFFCSLVPWRYSFSEWWKQIYDSTDRKTNRQTL